MGRAESSMPASGISRGQDGPAERSVPMLQVDLNKADLGLNSAGVVAGGAPLLVTAAANPRGNLDPFYFVRCESHKS